MRLQRIGSVDGIVPRNQTGTVKVSVQMGEPFGYTHLVLTREEAKGLALGDPVYVEVALARDAAELIRVDELTGMPASAAALRQLGDARRGGGENG